MIAPGERVLHPSPTVNPVLPRATEATKVQLYDPPLSSSTSPTVTPNKSTFSRLPTPGGQSPSIRDLGKKSMVKQRLAEIERTLSVSPSNSPIRSTRTHQALPSPTEGYQSRRNILLRHGTISSIGQDSVIDSYAGSRRESPISPFAKRLASIPSGEAIAHEDSWIARLSKLNQSEGPEIPDLFSPASRYSDGLPNTPTKTLPPALSINTSLTKSPTSRLLEIHRRTPIEATASPARTNVVPVPPPKNSSMASMNKFQPTTQSMSHTPESYRPTVPANLEQTRLSGIRKQINEVQIELKGLPETLCTIVADKTSAVPPSASAQDEDTKRVLLDIDDAVKRVSDQGERNAQGLTGIHAKMDALMQLRQIVPTVDQPGVTNEAVEAMLAKFEEVCGQIKVDIPMLSRRLEELASQKSAEGVPTAVENSTKEDTMAIHEKLQEVLSAVLASQTVPPRSGIEGDVGSGPSIDPMVYPLTFDFYLKLIIQ